jgi:hypothetical protein
MYAPHRIDPTHRPFCSLTGCPGAYGISIISNRCLGVPASVSRELRRLDRPGTERSQPPARSLQENPRAKRADAEAASDLTLMAQSGSAVSPRVIGARGRRDSASQGWTLAETEQALRVEVRNFILVIHVDGQLIKE